MNFSKVTVIFVIILSLVMTTSVFSQTRNRPKPQETEVKGHTMYTLMKPGGIPAIFNPEFITVAKARETFYPQEPLIVVADGDSAKGYSIWHLDGHEIVNDYINGKAITVTW